MKEITMFTMQGCPACEEAKRDIRQRKKAGTLCYNIKYKDVEKMPESKIPKKLEAVPMVMVDGQLKDYKDVLDRCPVKK